MLDASEIFDGTLNPITPVAITASRVSTNVIDTLIDRDWGAGDTMEVHVDVLTTFTAAGAATLQILYQTSHDNVTYETILESPVYPVANLTALVPGTSLAAKIFRYKVPWGQQLLETGMPPGRYHRLDYIVATGPFTAGAIFAYVTSTSDRQTDTTYPRNYAVNA